jgi:hypothetical protein
MVVVSPKIQESGVDFASSADPVYSPLARCSHRGIEMTMENFVKITAVMVRVTADGSLPHQSAAYGIGRLIALKQ